MVWLSLLVPAAWSQDEDAGETVFVTQGDGTPRVAGSAHVIGEKELEAHEYDDIGRVLGDTPGIYVRNEDGFGLRPNIGLRGANSDRSAKVTLLEDGIPLVPAPYAAPAAYYFPMATRLAGVEVFKGAAATQHGPQTIGGAINLRTRAVPTQHGGALDVAYGMRNTAKIHGWGALGSDAVGVLFEAAHLQTDGFKRLDTGGDTGFERTDLMLKGRLSHGAHKLVLKLGYGSEQSRETYLGLHSDDYSEDPYRRYAASDLGLMRWKRTQAELFWTVNKGPVRLQTAAYHHFLDRQWTKLNRFVDGPSIHGLLQQPVGSQSGLFLNVLRGTDSASEGERLLIGTNDRSFQAFGAQSTLRLSHLGKRWSNRLELGVRVHGDRVERIGTEQVHAMRDGAPERTEDPETTPVHNLASATALAVHLHDDFRWRSLHILPGIRVETVHTTFRHLDGTDLDPSTRVTTLPGLAMLQQHQNLQVFAGVHRGFSPVAPGQDAKIDPEVSWNMEVGGRLSDGQRLGEVVGYLNDYTNLTGQCTLSGGCRDDQVGQQFNGGRVWVGGFEASGHWELLLPGRLSLTPKGSYTFTWSRFRTGVQSDFPQFGTLEQGDWLPYVPVHQGSAKLALEHPLFGLSAGLTGRTGMRDTAGQGPLTDLDVPGRVLVDLAAHVQPVKDVRIYSTVVNATNSKALESWRPFGARPTAPFQWMLGVKLTP